MEIYTIFVAGFSFIAGVVLIILVWIIQAALGKSRSKSKAPANKNEPMTEIARLVRDGQTQNLVVEMDGISYKTFQELPPRQQRRLTFTSNVLAKWLAAPAPEPVSVAEPETPQPETAMPEPPIASQEAWVPEPPLAGEVAPQPEYPATPAEALSPQTPSVPLEPLPQAPPPEFISPFASDLEEAVKPVSTDLPDLVSGILNPPAESATPFNSIAMQINDILQTQLIGTPLASRGISMSDAPDHGVIFTLDGEQYQGVKDIPDEEVRQAIRAAVSEWETKK